MGRNVTTLARLILLTLVCRHIHCFLQGFSTRPGFFDYCIRNISRNTQVRAQSPANRLTLPLPLFERSSVSIALKQKNTTTTGTQDILHLNWRILSDSLALRPHIKCVFRCRNFCRPEFGRIIYWTVDFVFTTAQGNCD